METRELLAAVFDGDTRAFECLVRAQAARLYHIAYRVTGDRETSNDVIQETFLRLLSAKPPVEPIRSGDSWLARVTTRTAINMIGSQRARRRREERYAMARKQTVAAPPSRPQLPTELEPALSAVFHQLPPETRAAVWLHVVEGEAIRDVAKCLESSRSAVSRRIRAGLDTMRQRLRLHGCALLATVSLEDALRALSGPPPGTTVLEAIVAAGMTSGGTGATTSYVGSLEPAASAGTGGWLAGGSIVILSAAIIAAWIGLHTLRDDGAGIQEEPSKSPPLASPLSAESTSDREAAPPLEPARRPPLPASPPEILHAMEGTIVVRGEPVEGARVRVLLPPKDSERWSFERLYVRGEIGPFLTRAFRPPEVFDGVRTDARGRFRVSVPGSGVALLEALKVIEEGVFLGGVQPLDVPEDTEEEILLELGDDRFLGGTVKDSEGRGVLGAKVLAFPVHRDVYLACSGTQDLSNLSRAQIYRHLRESIRAFDVSCVTSSGDGSFLFPSLDPGAAYLVAVRSQGSSGVFIGPLKIPTSGATILLPEPVSLPGEAVILPAEAPAAGARIVVFGGIESRRGTPNSWRSAWLDVLRSASGGWFDVLESDGSGRFTAKSRASGEQGAPGVTGYALAVLEHGGAFHVAEPTWNAQRPLKLPLRIEFDPVVNLSEGRVLEALGGQPIAGARVTCYTGRRGFVYAADENTTDASGRFSLATGGDPFGVIIAEFDGYTAGGCFGTEHSFLGPAVSPAAREILAAQDIFLAISPSVGGIVVGPDGRPVPDCQLELRSCTVRPTEHDTARYLLTGVDAGTRAESACRFSSFVARTLFTEEPALFASRLSRSRRARAEEDGEFEIRHSFGTDDLLLWVHHPEFGETVVDPFEPLASKTRGARLDIRLPGSAEVKLVLTDGQGGVMAGIPVTIESVLSATEDDRCLRQWREDADRDEEREELQESHRELPGHRVTRTDALGRCAVGVSAASALQVSVRHSRASCSVRDSRPLQLGESRLLEIPFPQNQVLKGRITNAEGGGMRAFLSVRCRGDDSGAAVQTSFSTTGKSRDDGVFELTAAGAGPFDVSVHAPGFQQAELRDIQGDGEALHVRLERD